MSRRLSLVGQKFGRLAVQEFAGKDKNSQSYWNCICDCGNVKRILGKHLRSGGTISCGCIQKERMTARMTTHGLSNTKEFKIWTGIKSRCYNEKDKDYPDYGGRGIKACGRWLGREGFVNFLEDMGNCPDDMSLDRKDNDGDYCKENCRWATQEEQHNNKRSNVWYDYKGERKTVAQWARHLGISVGTLWARLTHGWSIERAFTERVHIEFRSKNCCMRQEYELVDNTIYNPRCGYASFHNLSRCG